MRKSEEDYLRIMYSIYEKQQDKKLGIKAVDIANILKISKAGVCQMMKKLSKKKFVKIKPYSKIYFTKKGLEEARKITHTHMIIEVFLKDILDYDLKKVHKEAHKLEHAFSSESIKRLDKFLGNPKISPYGEIIPHKKI